jgi:hypothetical protein
MGAVSPHPDPPVASRRALGSGISADISSESNEDFAKTDGISQVCVRFASE